MKSFNQQKAAELIRQQQQGLGKPIIAAQSNGQQFVAVGNTLHYSNKWKVFSDFLSDFIKTTFGEEWGNAELQKPLKQRHPILQWYNSLCELQKQHFDKISKVQSMPLYNSAICYLGLSYNLYLLKHNVELQKIYIHRLKDINQFHGAYYELIVAGCLIRSGFKLELEDETDENNIGQKKSAYIFVTNMGFHWDLDNERKGHAVMAYAIGIPDFNSKGYFSLSKIYRKKQRHIDIHDIMNSFQEYPAIPDTFNGDLPSNVFGENDPIPKIDETYFFDCIGEQGKYAKITSAIVKEDEKKAYFGTNTGHILLKELSDDQLQDYKNHPDAFFGIIREEGKSYDDDYEFFERLVEMNSVYSRVSLLKQMKNWQNAEELKKLSKDDLVLRYTEGIMAKIKTS